MGQYLIRTPSGDKGPFSLDQLEKLVAAQKIPVTMDVIESESGLAIPLADLILDVPAAAPPAPAPQPVAPSPGVTPLPAVAPAAPPGRAPAPRRAPAPTRGGPRASGGASQGRYVPPPKSPVPMIVGIVLVVGLLGVGGWLLTKSQSSDGLVGSWKIDMDKTLAEMRKSDPDFAKASPEEQKMAEGFARSMFESFRLEFTADRATLSIFGAEESGPYEIIARRGDAMTVKITGEQKTEQVNLTVQGNSLRMTNDGQSIHFRRTK